MNFVQKHSTSLVVLSIIKVRLWSGKFSIGRAESAKSTEASQLLKLIIH